jgi:hypothetical protein
MNIFVIQHKLHLVLCIVVLSVVMLSVIMPNVIMLSVVAPIFSANCVATVALEIDDN